MSSEGRKEGKLMKVKVESQAAPLAIGPYSQATMDGDYIFVSGQLPVDRNTGEFVSEDVAEQTRQSLSNIKAILAEANCTMQNVLKTTVLLADMSDFAAMNEVYATFFTEPFPARCAFQVAALPKGAKVEIEAIAKK